MILLHTNLCYDATRLTVLSHYIKLKIKAKLMCGARVQGRENPGGWEVVTRVVTRERLLFLSLGLVIEGGSLGENSSSCHLLVCAFFFMSIVCI